MAEIGAGSGTSYPTSLDTDNNQEVNSPNAGKTRARAEVINDLAAAIVALETELGTSPKGTAANVKTFLQTQHNLDGTHKTISTDTLSATGQITSTLAAGTKPLNVTSTTVCTNLNADLLDGYHASTSATYNTMALRDSGGNLYATAFLGNLTGNVTGNVTGSATLIGNMRIVRGAVQGSDGATLEGTGFTAAHPGTGSYTLTFSPAFSGVATIVASARNAVAFIGAYHNGSAYVVGVKDATSSDADLNFSFIAIGPA